MKNISLLLLFGCFLVPIFAQTEDRISGPYDFTGKITDVSGLPMAGINLYFTKGESNQTVHTDITGKFKISLQPGNYEIEVNKTNSRSFNAFISITVGGPNPSDVSFVLDPDDACCNLADGSAYPKPVSLPRPPYPPAARAVRAAGEVEVDLTVEPDGTVSAAPARSGHPLLRAASVKAARSAKFEPSTEQVKRTVVLTYVFLEGDDTAKTHYKNPYRIEVVSSSEPVQFTSY